MSPIASVPADTTLALPLDSDIECAQTEAEALPTTNIVASELLIQLGRDYFAIGDGPDTHSDADESRPKTASASISPQALANASPAQSAERDFWEDVAATSEKASQLPPSCLGKPHDTVAYAIATVSANYTLPASDRRSPNPTTPAASQAVRSPTSQPRDVSHANNVTGEHAPGGGPDLLDALASLLGFENIAGLEGVADLDPAAFSRVRELAAFALTAVATNRDSALKAAEGRKG